LKGCKKLSLNSAPADIKQLSVAVCHRSLRQVILHTCAR